METYIFKSHFTIFFLPLSSWLSTSMVVSLCGASRLSSLGLASLLFRLNPVDRASMRSCSRHEMAWETHGPPHNVPESPSHHTARRTSCSSWSSVMSMLRVMEGLAQLIMPDKTCNMENGSEFPEKRVQKCTFNQVCGVVCIFFCIISFIFGQLKMRYCQHIFECNYLARQEEKVRVASEVHAQNQSHEPPGNGQTQRLRQQANEWKRFCRVFRDPRTTGASKTAASIARTSLHSPRLWHFFPPLLWNLMNINVSMFPI